MSFKIPGRQEQYFAGYKIDIDAMLVVTPDTTAYPERFVATRGFSDNPLDFVVGLSSLEFIVVLDVERASAGTEQCAEHDWNNDVVPSAGNHLSLLYGHLS